MQRTWGRQRWGSWVDDRPRHWPRRVHPITPDDSLLVEGHTVVGMDSFEDCHPRAMKEANLEGAPAGRDTLVETDLVDLAVVGAGSGPLHDDEGS